MKNLAALLIACAAAANAHADQYGADCHVFATGVENAGDYRVKGYTKEQYDQMLAERLWNRDLEEHAYLLWNQGSDVAFRGEYAKATPKAVAAKAYAYCITHRPN